MPDCRTPSTRPCVAKVERVLFLLEYCVDYIFRDELMGQDVGVPVVGTYSVFGLVFVKLRKDVADKMGADPFPFQGFYNLIAESAFVVP